MTTPAPAPPPASSADDDAAIAAAKSKVGAAAKAMVANVRAFGERTTALLAAPSALRESARQQTAVLKRQQVDKELRGKPVTSLRDVAGKGARIGALSKAGYTTVADVMAAPAQRLQAVPGVGSQTAQQVSMAAELVKEEVTKETRVRFDPDRRDPGQTQLLATLHAARQADNAVSSYRSGSPAAPPPRPGRVGR